jgi:ABC-2 type transport system ATP-binding protein
MSVIQFKNVSRAYYKTERVLERLDLQVAAGEIVGLIGRNGSGKTTLIHLLMGMLEPQKGRVQIFGLDPVKHPVEVKQRIGYVAEDQILPGSLTAPEIFRIYQDLYPGWDLDLAKELVERFSVRMNRQVHTFSKGQARSLALLLALAVRPELLILDEPAGGMDPAARRDFLSTSIEHAAESGTTILFSSHQMTDVERLASRVLLLNDGKVALDRPIDALTEKFALATMPLSWMNAQGKKIPGYLGSRRGSQSVSALFERESSELQHELDLALGDGVGNCRSIPLEELFIEFVGGENS